MFCYIIQLPIVRFVGILSDQSGDLLQYLPANHIASFVFFRKVLVRDGLQEPRAVSVNPFRGFLFYTDWGDKPHIGTLGMDGNPRPLYNRYLITDNLGWPNALTIDYYAEKIFWADARLDYIAFADFYGKNRRYVIQSGLSHVFAMTVFEDTIYWTDWEYKSIERAHKFTGKNRRNVTFTMHRPMDIQVSVLQN